MDMRKVSWAHVVKVTEPGRYMFRFGFVIVTADDLTIWQKYPDAAFTSFRCSRRAPRKSTSSARSMCPAGDRRVDKATRAHHFVTDKNGGHGARAPLPTLTSP